MQSAREFFSATKTVIAQKQRVEGHKKAVREKIAANCSITKYSYKACKCLYTYKYILALAEFKAVTCNWFCKVIPMWQNESFKLSTARFELFKNWNANSGVCRAAFVRFPSWPGIPFACHTYTSKLHVALCVNCKLVGSQWLQLEIRFHICSSMGCIKVVFWFKCYHKCAAKCFQLNLSE